jgi:hypothetical protein
MSKTNADGSGLDKANVESGAQCKIDGKNIDLEALMQ